VSPISYQDAKEVGDRLIALLSARGISPPGKSAGETELLSLVDLLDIWRNPERIRQMQQNGSVIRQAAGIHDLAAKVLSAEKLPDFRSFEAHLKLIAEAQAFTTISQNNVADGRDDISRKMAELYVGCLAIHCGSQVLLDDPKGAKGDNPNVMLTYDTQRWSLGIKTLVSARHGQTIFENIERAAQQITASAAQRGLVLINAKNVIDHDRLWTPAHAFADENEATEALRAELRSIAELADHNRPSSDWDRVFSGKAVPPVLFMGQSVAYLPVGGEAFRAPTPLKALVAFAADRKPDDDGSDLACCLNHWMQVVLRGDPGPPPS
jgi:hypothetical protein